MPLPSQVGISQTSVGQIDLLFGKGGNKDAHKRTTHENNMFKFEAKGFGIHSMKNGRCTVRALTSNGRILKFLGGNIRVSVIFSDHG